MHDKSPGLLPRVYVATSNPGKIRDFEGAAGNLGVTIGPLPGFDRIPQAVEDGATFEENARIKAEHYSRAVPGELVLADDSGLAVDALNGAPGVHSARYATVVTGRSPASGNSADEENNRLVIDRLQGIPRDRRSGKFVCVLAAARDGMTLAVFQGEVQGQLLTAPRGDQGFGYDPLFYFPQLGKTFAEISASEKARYSHRGEAFRKFLDWYGAEGLKIGVVFDSKSK
jgi:XTP/dITP diphosphohydrolase